ncbi:MAG: hypothetical protein ABR986_05180, partial [Methanomassiliicoccales archaeon]
VAPTDPRFLIGPPNQLIGKSMYDVFPKIDADRLIQNIQTVLETGNKMGVEVTLWQFMKAGLPITIVTLLLSVVMLSML